jgi:two-component system LytT family response regulator
MKIRSVIIDDEPNNIENLSAIIAKWCPEVMVVGSATSAREGIEVIRSADPDLVFLDIQMPELSGFEVLKAFSSVNFEVIFVTAYDQYGIQAIKFSALDYLLKPIDVTEMQEAIKKASAKLATKRQNLSVGNLIDFIKRSQKDLPKIALPTMQETHYVKVSEILRCESSDNYTRFYLRAGETILVCKTLKEFSELLQPFGFLRTHQSHLVNTDHIKSLLKEDGGTLMMEDGTKIPVSRQNMETVKKTLQNDK